jgi:hypothetical protein
VVVFPFFFLVVVVVVVVLVVGRVRSRRCQAWRRTGELRVSLSLEVRGCFFDVGAGLIREKAKFLRPRSMLRMRVEGVMGWRFLAAWRRRWTRTGLVPDFCRPQDEQKALRVTAVSLRRGLVVMVAWMIVMLESVR